MLFQTADRNVHTLYNISPSEGWGKGTSPNLYFFYEILWMDLGTENSDWFPLVP